ncbi:MAG: FAD-dependent oxidoreductase [Parabacteroides sp.]
MITRRDFLKVTAAGGVLTSIGRVEEARAAVRSVMPDGQYCQESERQIPLLAEVDLVVAGGSSRAVAAAAAAARCGIRVYLVCPQPYLGEDICGAHLYDRLPDEPLQTALAQRIFDWSKQRPTPLQVKKTLEDELIDLGVDFLYSSYVTEALVGENGQPAGVVVANRSGREAIRCRTIIDATHEATVAACLGAEISAFHAGPVEFDFTVVGNAPKEAPEIIRAEPWKEPLQVGGKNYPATRYTFRFDLPDASYAALQTIEQKIRTRLWDADQVDSSDRLWYMPLQQVRCQATAETRPGSLRELSQGVFQARNIPHLWILGPMAGLSRALAAQLMRPVPALLLGDLVGEWAAEAIRQVPKPNKVVVRQSAVDAFRYGEIGELLQPLRPWRDRQFVESPAGALPVLGRYEVVVMGGGTAGASAGISAARQGAKTLVLEYLHGLGGLSTLGMIGVYWDGFRGGFTSEVDRGVLGMASADHPRRPKQDGHFPADWKMEWLRKELLAAGGTLWFGVMGCGAVTENGRVKGVVVATPFGRGVVLADMVIDSSGSADIAIAAGAAYEYTGAKSLAIQGAGTGKWAPGDYYNNNDWLFVDDSDVLDISRAFVQAKSKMRREFDIVKMPQTRERRRVVGDYAVSVYDVMAHRRYPDTISYHKSSFDTHGMTMDPLFTLNPPEKRHKIYDADVPLRCLLPKGLEGILTTGLGASAHRDAMPVIRMQACLQNQGYAVGYLSACCVKQGRLPRQIDLKPIQRHLVKIGNLPERVLTDKAFKGYSTKELKQAAAQVSDQYQGLELLLSDPKRSLPLLQAQMAQTTDTEARVMLASILCMLGDASSAPILAEAIRRYPTWDSGWHYTGMGQFGECLSRLDALIMACGAAGDASTWGVVAEKAVLLKPEDAFSHFRAVAQAAEKAGRGEAVPVLAALLRQPGVRYHAMESYAEARRQVVPGSDDTSTRNRALKELFLVGALYRCGDSGRIGQEILEHYACGLQGHYARYACEILKSR